MHPFRLPSPGLWRDVLEKMKADGLNAVSFYFDWGYHSPARGVYDFTATPGFVAEFGGGWFDYWGSVGTYPCTAVRQGSGYERVFYGANIANSMNTGGTLSPSRSPVPAARAMPSRACG